LLSGYFQSGFTLSNADFFLGTSAGAIVGSQLATGQSPIVMAEAILGERRQLSANPSFPREAAALSELPRLFAKAQKGEHERIEVGAYALAAVADDELSRHVALFSAIIGPRDWPNNLGIVAIDVANGRPRVLAGDCGVTLGTAVAASCSLPGLHPTVPIGERNYMDGGLRSAANADLVGSFDTVLILSFQPGGPIGQRVASRANFQAAELSAVGVNALVISPDAQCLEAIGFGGHDFSRCPEVVRRAIRQGCEMSEVVAKFWN
jgi:NTE family protein